MSWTCVYCGEDVAIPVTVDGIGPAHGWCGRKAKWRPLNHPAILPEQPPELYGQPTTRTEEARWLRDKGLSAMQIGIEMGIGENTVWGRDEVEALPTAWGV